MKHPILVCFLLFFSFVSPSFADDLSNLLQTHYKGIKNFSADFEQTLSHKESGNTEKRKGKIAFRKPFELAWLTQKPHEETLLITKSDIWNYIPDEKVAYRYNHNLVNDASDVIHVITGQADLMRDFDVKRIGLENSWQRLKIYPKKPSVQLVEADIWVDPNTGIMQKCVFMDFYGNSNEIRFLGVKENTALRDSLFSFTPPKGIDVEDKRNESQERDLLR